MNEKLFQKYALQNEINSLVLELFRTALIDELKNKRFIALVLHQRFTEQLPFSVNLEKHGFRVETISPFHGLTEISINGYLCGILESQFKPNTSAYFSASLLNYDEDNPYFMYSAEDVYHIRIDLDSDSIDELNTIIKSLQKYKLFSVIKNSEK